ncbi:hypothetical protein KY289_008315 [Solanum tuberosum]|nr:hypothetical protein KY289_008315 [Solanum tuberosum]
MINTRSSTSQENTPNVESLAQQLYVIASKLNTIDSLVEDVATLKAKNGCTQEGETSHGPVMEENLFGEKRKKTLLAQCGQKILPGSYTQRWNFLDLKEVIQGMDFEGKKYFCYYQTSEEHKVDITAMYLESDALDLFSWINCERTLLYWKELGNKLARSLSLRRVLEWAKIGN